MVSVLVKIKNSYIRGKEVGRKVLDNIVVHAVFLDPGVCDTGHRSTERKGLPEQCQLKAFSCRTVSTASHLLKV